MTMDVSPIEQNYQYGLYGQGSKIPQFGTITARPQVGPATKVGTTGIPIPTPISKVSSENGIDKIATGYDGEGLRRMSAEEMAFKGISKMFIA